MIYMDFGYAKGPDRNPVNITFELDGLRRDGTFEPGANATIWNNGTRYQSDGCPI